MRVHRIAMLAAFAASVAAVPLSAAKAQYYGPPCTPFPLSWPFCVAGAAVGTAATIATAPFGAVAGPPYYYYASPSYGYYGAGYGPWNRPSRSDHVARQLNRQELAQMSSGY